MYSHCTFCNRPLGGNAVIEEFPVGRRLAFDPARGRLWAVCRKCERWNLSPLEERWEAIEAAERLFRDTRTRVSTENIGLARHAEGLELVRIGQPLRPEFAAWRYGDQFGRRRRRAILVGAGFVAVVGTVATVGVAAGIISGALGSQTGNLVNLWLNARTLVRVRTAEGELLKLKRSALTTARLQQASGGEWSLVLGEKKQQRVFTGREAERVAGLIMPRLNASGARSAVVQEAVREIQRVGSAHAYLDELVTNIPLGVRTLKAGHGAAAQLGKLPKPRRLALEMALHEEQERRALEGELKALELAWEVEEEVAAISDDLLLPDGIRSRHRDLGTHPEGGPRDESRRGG
jgi:hypothetical protein